MSQFGKFHDFCRDSTLPVCNLFFLTSDNSTAGPIDRSCELRGFIANGEPLRNLGSIILCGFALVAVVYLVWRSERKQAAVGRREMQIFLLMYGLVSLAEIFSVGGFLNNATVLKWFSSIHIAAIATTCWILLLNAIVGYQLLDDGTILSLSLFFVSGAMIFIGTGYIALDTGFGYTDTFKPDADYKNYGLYVLYLLFPIVCLAGYFILESILVLRVLGETRPMLLLGGAAVLFAIGQVFAFVISVHLCNAADGRIDGALFETLFTLLAVITLWAFWSSITEDTWVDEPLNPSMSDADYSTHRSGRFDSQYA
ncbi:hypothetical protein TWF569_009285 [Orbilia oligospora]|uniref:Chitin synthase export chaperone n=3 Tax=Orbilia oligospora TaxID=2813651 RepID=A0A8H2E5X3_ORBOL|nr:hypothetical protein TWF569_009285 [Orbilia oligospora]KAF3184582.1 hypothetical protein TWF225_005881 [Orbilia oligospora]KAF3237725.1 hypothetical protein TWF217_002048 [Orbilia oligospora]KAF3240926.1 hypothetical protein TWF128_011152 [Orbilia oligospora]KAF3288172.1 hypothetical protein TWF132_007993 [Orbilia oligospora]